MAGGEGAPRGGSVGDRIAFGGHATVLIECQGVRLLTDPILRSRVVHLRRQVRPVPERMTADLDAVLISHLHHDHFDPPSLRKLGGRLPMLVPPGAGSWVRRRGFDGARELALGERAEVGRLAIEAVPARHDGSRLGGPRAAAIGFIVLGERTVYFAGDTELFAEMAEWSGQLDVALLPVSGWGPTLGEGHMDAHDAARAVALLRPRLAIPIHWGSLLAIGSSRRARARLPDPPLEFAAHVRRLAPDTEVRILAPGEEIRL